MKIPMLVCSLILAASAAAAPPASAPPASSPPASSPPASQPADAGDPYQAPTGLDDPRVGLLTRLPDRGGVPPIVDMLYGPSREELNRRASARQYKQQLRRIRHLHFGTTRVPELRAEGIERIGEFVDPAAFHPMIEVFGHEQDDVRLAMLDHFMQHGDNGQAALAWAAIHSDDMAIRNEATGRMVSPPAAPALKVLDGALRSNEHEVANAAGALAGSLHAIQTIPLLMFAQATRDPAPQDEGDLAWIAFETQHAYVQNLLPVVGDNAGAFQPILGIINEGIVLRVLDAVVIVYRTEIHQSLVSMTTADWGQSTAHLGYDMGAWWHWYNDEYVPFKNEQAKLRALGAPVVGDPVPPPTVP